MIITTEHLFTCPTSTGRAGFCARGARAWFKRYGLSWSDFVREGIAEERMAETGDPLAARLIVHARARGPAGG